MKLKHRNRKKNDISPTTPTTPTNGQKVDGVKVSIVGKSSTNSPTNSTNSQIVDEVVNSVVDDLSINSTNGYHFDEIVAHLQDEQYTNSTNLTEMVEEIATVTEVEESQSIETQIENDNLIGHLTELQQLLLMCGSLIDLLAIKEIYSPEELIEAYKTLNIYQRKRVRKLILQEEELINVSGQMMTPCQLLSLFAGQPDKTIRVGDKVHWRECSGHLESWSPWQVIEIKEDGWVQLNLLDGLVPLCELRLCLPTK